MADNSGDRPPSPAPLSPTSDPEFSDFLRVLRAPSFSTRPPLSTEPKEASDEGGHAKDGPARAERIPEAEDEGSDERNAEHVELKTPTRSHPCRDYNKKASMDTLGSEVSGASSRDEFGVSALTFNLGLRPSYTMNEAGDFVISDGLDEGGETSAGIESVKEKKHEAKRGGGHIDDGSESLRSSIGSQSIGSRSRSIGSRSVRSESIRKASRRGMERALSPHSLDDDEAYKRKRRHDKKKKKKSKKKHSREQEKIRKIVTGSARKATARAVQFTNVPEQFKTKSPVLSLPTGIEPLELSAPDFNLNMSHRSPSMTSVLTPDSGNRDDRTLSSSKASSIATSKYRDKSYLAESAQTKFQKGLHCARRKRYPLARSKLRAALKARILLHEDVEHVSLAPVHEMIGLVERKTGQYGKSRLHLLAAREICEKALRMLVEEAGENDGDEGDSAAAMTDRHDGVPRPVSEPRQILEANVERICKTMEEVERDEQKQQEEEEEKRRIRDAPALHDVSAVYQSSGSDRDTSPMPVRSTGAEEERTRAWAEEARRPGAMRGTGGDLVDWAIVEGREAPQPLSLPPQSGSADKGEGSHAESDSDKEKAKGEQAHSERLIKAVAETASKTTLTSATEGTPEEGNMVSSSADKLRSEVRASDLQTQIEREVGNTTILASAGLPQKVGDIRAGAANAGGTAAMAPTVTIVKQSKDGGTTGQDCGGAKTAAERRPVTMIDAKLAGILGEGKLEEEEKNVGGSADSTAGRPRSKRRLADWPQTMSLAAESAPSKEAPRKNEVDIGVNRPRSKRRLAEWPGRVATASEEEDNEADSIRTGAKVYGSSDTVAEHPRHKHQMNQLATRKVVEKPLQGSEPQLQAQDHSSDDEHGHLTESETVQESESDDDEDSQDDALDEGQTLKASLALDSFAEETEETPLDADEMQEKPVVSDLPQPGGALAIAAVAATSEEEHNKADDIRTREHGHLTEREIVQESESNDDEDSHDDALDKGQTSNASLGLGSFAEETEGTPLDDDKMHEKPVVSEPERKSLPQPGGALAIAAVAVTSEEHNKADDIRTSEHGHLTEKEIVQESESDDDEDSQDDALDEGQTSNASLGLRNFAEETEGSPLDADEMQEKPVVSEPEGKSLPQPGGALSIAAVAATSEEERSKIDNIGMREYGHLTEREVQESEYDDDEDSEDDTLDEGQMLKASLGLDSIAEETEGSPLDDDEMQEKPVVSEPEGKSLPQPDRALAIAAVTATSEEEHSKIDNIGMGEYGHLTEREVQEPESDDDEDSEDDTLDEGQMLKASLGLGNIAAEIEGSPLVEDEMEAKPVVSEPEGKSLHQPVRALAIAAVTGTSEEGHNEADHIRTRSDTVPELPSTEHQIAGHHEEIESQSGLISQTPENRRLGMGRQLATRNFEAAHRTKVLGERQLGERHLADDECQLRNRYHALIEEGEEHYNDKQYAMAVASFNDAKFALLAIAGMPETQSPIAHAKLRDAINSALLSERITDCNVEQFFRRASRHQDDATDDFSHVNYHQAASRLAETKLAVSEQIELRHKIVSNVSDQCSINSFEEEKDPEVNDLRGLTMEAILSLARIYTKQGCVFAKLDQHRRALDLFGHSIAAWEEAANRNNESHRNAALNLMAISADPLIVASRDIISSHYEINAADISSSVNSLMNTTHMTALPTALQMALSHHTLGIEAAEQVETEASLNNNWQIGHLVSLEHHLEALILAQETQRLRTSHFISSMDRHKSTGCRITTRSRDLTVLMAQSEEIAAGAGNFMQKCLLFMAQQELCISRACLNLGLRSLSTRWLIKATSSMKDLRINRVEAEAKVAIYLQSILNPLREKEGNVRPMNLFPLYERGLSSIPSEYEEWPRLMVQFGMAMLQKGLHIDAQTMLNKATSSFCSSDPPPHYFHDILHALDMLILIDVREGNMIRAVEMMDSRMEFVSHWVGRHSVELANDLHRAACIQSVLSNHEQCAKHLEDSLNVGSCYDDYDQKSTMKLLAVTHDALGDVNSATNEYECVLAMEKDAINQARLMNAMANLHIGDVLAVSFLKKSLAIQEDEGIEDVDLLIDTMILYGNAMASKNSFSEANYWYESALNSNPDKSPIHPGNLRASYNKGVNLFRSGDIIGAGHAFGIILDEVDARRERLGGGPNPEIPPGTTFVLNAIGNIYFANKDYNGAIEKFEESIALDDDCLSPCQLAGARCNIATAHYKMGHYEESEINFNEALRVIESAGVASLGIKATIKSKFAYVLYKRNLFQRAYDMFTSAALTGKEHDSECEFSALCESYAETCRLRVIDEDDADELPGIEDVTARKPRFDSKLIPIRDDQSATRYTNSVYDQKQKVLTMLGVEIPHQISIEWTCDNTKVLCDEALKYLLGRVEDSRKIYAMEFELHLIRKLNSNFASMLTMLDDTPENV